MAVTNEEPQTPGDPAMTRLTEDQFVAVPTQKWSARPPKALRAQLARGSVPGLSQAVENPRALQSTRQSRPQAPGSGAPCNPITVDACSHYCKQLLREFFTKVKKGGVQEYRVTFAW
jgi:hypothetical protein